MNILIIKDERKTSELIQLYLQRNGYTSLATANGRIGLEMPRTYQPDLIVLDLMLPGLDGLDLCRILHAEAYIPIIIVNTAQHTVTKAGQSIIFTPKEFRLLETPLREPGQVFSRVELLEKAFGLDYDGLERTIDVHIRNLRQKIEPNPNQPQYLQTVFGVGYRFEGNGG